MEIKKEMVKTFKRIFCFILISSFLFFASGCSLLSSVLSAGIAYGIYELQNK